MGIAIHNVSSSGDGPVEAMNLSAAIGQTASGILGTTVQFADLVSWIFSDYPHRGLRGHWHDTYSIFRQVIPFVAGGFMYIGAVAVLPTCVEEGGSDISSEEEGSFFLDYLMSCVVGYTDYYKKARASRRRYARYVNLLF